MKNYTDEEIIIVIEKIMEGDGDDDQMSSWFSNELSLFMPGISDLIFYSKEKLAPKEILRLARERNKPILL